MAEKKSGRQMKVEYVDEAPRRSQRGRKSIYSEMVQNLIKGEKKAVVITEPTTSSLLSLRKAIAKYEYKDVLEAYVSESGDVVLAKKDAK